MTVIRHQAQVPLSAAGRRFDQALAEMFPDYSRSRLAGWIKAGAVTLDGAVAPPRQLLRGGEQVRLEAELANEVESAPEAIDLAIVHEDAHLLVLDKPAGLVVHPGAGNPAGTLLNALLHHDPKLAELPRAGIVHRLDKDTSGLMVVARSLPAHTALVEMLSRHAVERQYEAAVLGTLVAGGTVDAPIGRHMGDRLRQAVRDEEDGKHAITHYRLRERFRAHSLIQCNLETGRTHQIRVHMAHIHHPLVGDPLYGGSLRLPKGATPELVAALRGFRRQALHAERLAFEHPVTGEAMAFEARRPADMEALIATLRADALEHRGP
ncbi:23S rRNA pseudouridine(1911/1915/1917) synthase RluD [Frateuria terrea]|uniref:Pseudouridine synthase n=1 Tax=Frateuria terrea TaxID=529704 RepID=A0A1H6R5K3_9GAMM|nr:23S rRNA pseudouridine(1911/1915/1917) synthase RluD [Frateuria terrea]SEI51168.1 23S rRNA pseudouridine1911/1915/1917 synthase [Frateuria terrea]SFP16084.1 23S rRNA pseudouridine1911/1915/1917 synthase [Frateuria terrea]